MDLDDLAPDLRADREANHKGKRAGSLAALEKNRKSGARAAGLASSVRHRLAKSPISLPAVSFLKDEG